MMTKENKIMINYILESHAIMRMKKKNNNKTKKKSALFLLKLNCFVDFIFGVCVC